MYADLLRRRHLGLDSAWQAVCQLLMTCDVWDRGGWHPFLGELVLMERNNYRHLRNGQPNRYLRDAMLVGDYLASSLGVVRADLADHVGLYFQEPAVSGLQPNNIRGHAFRSIVAETITRFGDPELQH